MVFNGQSTGTGDQVGEEHGETRGTDYFRSPNTGIHRPVSDPVLSKAVEKMAVAGI